MTKDTRKTTYFFDACIAPRHVEILALMHGDDVLLHMFNVEGFDRDDEDVVWIPKVASLGYVLVTTDNAQRRKVVEATLRESVKIRTVFLPGGFSQLCLVPQARFLVKEWEGIAKETRSCREGETFLVSMNGKVRRDPAKK